MDSHRTRASNSTPSYELVEDVARLLQVTSDDLRERLCPDRAQQIPAFCTWLRGASIPPQALPEIRREFMNSRTPDLVQIKARFEHLYCHLANERKH
ncbi:hypothetical protein [uncultured Roseibium sp.]|uniref:hypothetical protein n=1 Tax=uncultured Roseibium sp. TaxID=1936171 RepID=UPI0032170DED